MAAIKTDAARLVKSLVEKYQEAGLLGSLSCTVYDTAWVSMVKKVIDGKEVRLFPSSFQYILDSQQPDGGWLSYGSEINGIMNTAAALHALCHHKSARLRLDDALPLDLDSRIQRAEFALRQQLEKWDVGATLHVGYEILVPSLLDQLEAQGLFFEFPGKHRLLKAYSQKMKIFDAALFYSTEQYSALHSLEAFIGKVDSDKLKHNTRDGSMLASPSSTAAYLIHSSHWDEEAEAYLRRAISKGEGQGCGGVPSAFPSTNFDMIWTLSALFQGGFTLEELGMNEVDRISEVIGTSLERGGGLLGFAPEVVPDADDTSKAITILQFLGKPAPVEPMIKESETFDHFQTYRFEKDPSFTVNCNVLACLLATDIQKPHWANLSPHYATMLFTQSLMKFLASWVQGDSDTLTSNDSLVQRLLITLFQALTRTLQAHNQDGSWGDKQAEPSAYAILTLISLAPLPVGLAPQIITAIDRGRTLLSGVSGASEPDFVTYRSKNFHKAYILAALNAPLIEQNLDGKVSQLFYLPWRKIEKLQKFSKRLPLLASLPDWMVKASLIESHLFLPQLLDIRLNIFPRKDMSEDEHFEYIPYTWTVSNNLKGQHIRGEFLHEMMIISFLNYQADEYMETCVSACFAGRLDDARSLIDRLFHEHSPQKPGHSLSAQNGENGATNGAGFTSEARKNDITDGEGGIAKKLRVAEAAGDSGNGVDEPRVWRPTVQEDDVTKTLGRFVGYVLNRPNVQTASI
ncbi:MAG: hypothetical protein Q9181_007307 [Wetmoreana brouardii]